MTPASVNIAPAVVIAPCPVAGRLTGLSYAHLQNLSFMQKAASSITHRAAHFTVLASKLHALQVLPAKRETIRRWGGLVKNISSQETQHSLKNI